MDESLQRLARELRKETCPRRVHDEVARRIASRASAPTRFPYTIRVAFATLVILCSLAAWRWMGSDNSAPYTRIAQRGTDDRAQIAVQAEGALGLIGSIVLDAGVHSEEAIFKGAVPPLRNSLETTKAKITQLLTQ